MEAETHISNDLPCRADLGLGSDGRSTPLKGAEKMSPFSIHGKVYACACVRTYMHIHLLMDRKDIKHPLCMF